MKPIYLHKTDDLRAHIDQVNGRATTHTLAWYDITAAGKRAEKQLTDSGVPKKMWRGVQIKYIPAGPGKAYARKGHHITTSRAVLEYRSGGWAMIEIAKIDSFADTAETFRLIVSTEVIDRVRAEACRNYVTTVSEA